MDDVEFLIQSTDRDQFKRLDQYLAAKIKDLSRTFIKRLYEEGMITATNSKGEELQIELKKMPPVETLVSVEVPPPIPDEALPQNIPLDILYEDEFLLFINKPAGLVTHPAPGHPDKTLVNALLYHVKDLQGIGGTKRPGIVHRLDRGTSGVMVVAKEQKTHEALVVLFSKHDLLRRYEALAVGTFGQQQGIINGNIGRHPVHRQKMTVSTRGGRHAVTHYSLIEQFDKVAHVQLQLETGRTHQIRVHLANVLHHAILNDATYGNPNEHKQRLGKVCSQAIGDYPYPFLHAKMLSLVHPMTGKKLEFEVARPLIFQAVLDCLKGEHIHE